jgi:hypothetical protein
MRRVGRATLICVITSLVLSVSGCISIAPVDIQPKAQSEKDYASFPYHPLIYHLDLSFLAYKLSRQTMVWPFDPYYEEVNIFDDGRLRFMAKVRSWASAKGEEQLSNSMGIEAYRGPGVLGGFDDNVSHDPILYRYDRIHPWSNSITNIHGTWIEDVTPKAITERIKDVYVCYRKAGGTEETVSINQIPFKRDNRVPDTGDTLLAFEGGTGDKGEVGQPASQSLMGYVLLRKKTGDSYDVHIAFRGTQSGSTNRAILEALSDEKATGNPDWITDMGYNRISSSNGAMHISTIGAVHRGFAQSMKSILPNVFHCLNKVAKIKKDIIPDNIYVTGHSLGGALVQHFVSAVLLGNQYNFPPSSAGSKLPAALIGWPWKQIKLITYSAPRAGDKQWARTLTVSGLQSEFFSTLFNPYDEKALSPSDPKIVARLLDADHSAGYRVLNSRDPATTEKGSILGIYSGKHVGKTVYINKYSIWDAFTPPDMETHRLDLMRKDMSASIADLRTPTKVLYYWKNKEINFDRNLKEKGSVEDLMKLVAVVKKYYLDNRIWFDQAAFDRDVRLRLMIDRGE